MTLHSNTLAALVAMVLNNYMEDGAWAIGTVTSGSANTTVIDSTRYEADDYWQNTNPRSWAKILSTTDNAAPVGEERAITDFTQSSGTATTVAFTATVGAGDTYAFMNKYRWAEVKGAINLAIARANTYGAHVEKIDESLVLVASVWEYTLPQGFTHLFRVSMADGNGNFPDPVPADQWSVVRGLTQPRLRFEHFPVEKQFSGFWWGQYWADVDFSSGRNLRIEGLQKQPALDKDADLCFLDPEYICAQAAAHMYSRRVKRQDVDTDANYTQYQINQPKADEVLARMKIQFPPNTRRVV